jgi:hypothetical protein
MYGGTYAGVNFHENSKPLLCAFLLYTVRVEEQRNTMPLHNASLHSSQLSEYIFFSCSWVYITVHNEIEACQVYKNTNDLYGNIFVEFRGE